MKKDIIRTCVAGQGGIGIAGKADYNIPRPADVQFRPSIRGFSTFNARFNGSQVRLFLHHVFLQYSFKLGAHLLWKFVQLNPLQMTYLGRYYSGILDKGD